MSKPLAPLFLPEELSFSCLFSDAKAGEDQPQNIVGCRRSSQAVESGERIVEIDQKDLVGER
jgi:hypothetical protein